MARGAVSDFTPSFLERALAFALVALMALWPAISNPATAWAPDVLLALLTLLTSARRGLVPGLGSPLAWLATAVLGASHLVAEAQGPSFQSLGGWCRLALAVIVGCHVGSEVAGRVRFAWALGVAAAVSAVHGALQLLWIHPWLLGGLEAQDQALAAQLSDGRANGVFLLPGHFGAFAAAGAVAAAGLVISIRPGVSRRLALVVASLAVLGVGLSGSFGAALVLGAGAGALGLLVTSGRQRVLLVVGIVLLVASLAAAGFARRSPEFARESPAAARALNWTTAWRLVRDRPILGQGGGAFAWTAERVRPAAANEARHAHQAFLEAAAEHGAVALPLLAAWAGLVGVAAWRARGEAVGAGLAAAALVVLGHGLIDFAWSDPSWAVPAAATCGAALGAGRAPLLPARQWDLHGWRAAVALAVPIAILLGATVPSSLASGAREDALAAAARGEHAAAGELLERARQFTPDDSELAATSALASLALAESLPGAAAAERADLVVRATESAAEAVALSPRRAIHRALHARCLALEGRSYEAFVEAAAAAAAAPHREDLRAERDALALVIDSRARAGSRP